MESHKSPWFQTTKQFWFGLEDPGPTILIDRTLGRHASTTTTEWTVQGSGSADRQQNRRNSLMMLMLTINVLMHLEKVNWQVKCIKVSEYKHSQLN